MKRIIAILLIVFTLFALASCSLIRKATPKEEQTRQTESDDGNVSDTKPADTEADTDDSPAVRYTVDEAYELLSHSFPDYKTDEVKIERTDLIIAENDGTEYYIFNVSLPKKAETDTAAESDTESADTKDTETKAVEYAEPVRYYVSVNGVVHTELVDNNVDNRYAENVFIQKHGEKDDAGHEYVLRYEGLLKSQDNLCYNFAVYKKMSDDKEEYYTNFLVTIDGKYSAETARH
ncbi:MAG: hypothetical protein IJS45_03810 [Clostridia bacterium]|nr:hypothetical protein [Clostridia bacterium]